MITEEELKSFANDKNFYPGVGVFLDVPNNPYTINFGKGSFFATILGGKKYDSAILSKQYFGKILKELEESLQIQLALENKINTQGFLNEGITLDRYLSFISGNSSNGALIGGDINSVKNGLKTLKKKSKKIISNDKKTIKEIEKAMDDARKAADSYVSKMQTYVQLIRHVEQEKDPIIRQQMLDATKATLYSEIKEMDNGIEMMAELATNFTQVFLQHGGSTPTTYTPSRHQDNQEEIDLMQIFIDKTKEGNEINLLEKFIKDYWSLRKESGIQNYSQVRKGKYLDQAKELVRQANAIKAFAKGEKGQEIFKNKNMIEGVNQIFSFIKNNGIQEEDGDLVLKITENDTEVILSASQGGFAAEAIHDLVASVALRLLTPKGKKLLDKKDIKNVANTSFQSESSAFLNKRVLLEFEYEYLDPQGNPIKRKQYEEEAKKLDTLYRKLNGIPKNTNEYKNTLTEIDIAWKNLSAYKKIIKRTKNSSGKMDKTDNAFILENDKGEKIILNFSEKNKNAAFLSGVEFNSGSLSNNLDLMNLIDEDIRGKILNIALNLSNASQGRNDEGMKQQVEEVLQTLLTGNFMRFMFNDKNFEEYAQNITNQTEPNVLHIFQASGKYAPASRIIAPLIHSIEAKIRNENVYEDIITARILYSQLTANELWTEEFRNQYNNNKSASWAYVANQVAATTHINMEIDMALLNALYSF